MMIIHPPNVDEPILELLDKGVIIFQDKTGIPKWKLVASYWKLYAVLSVVRDFAFDVHWLSMSLTIAWALYMFWLWSHNESEKFMQEVADTLQIAIYNKYRGTLLAILFRTTVAIITLLGIIVFTWSQNAMNLVAVTGIYLLFVHTFPMTGPTFKERIKNFVKSFKVRQKEVTSNV